MRKHSNGYNSTMVSSVAFVFSTIGSFLSILLSLSPTPKLIRAVKSNNFAEVSYTYLALGHAGYTLWLTYASFSGILEMIAGNACNFMISLLLNTVYLHAHNQLGTALIVYIPSIATLLAFCFYLDKPEVIGVTASIFGCLMYLSMIIKLKECIESREVRFLDLNINIAGFLCSLAWLIYGILSVNFVVIVPNFLGVCISSTIFFVYFWASDALPLCFCPTFQANSKEEKSLLEQSRLSSKLY